MKFHVVAVGHRMPAWVNAGFSEYARRMPREAQIVLTEIKPALRGKDTGVMAMERVLEIEHKRIAGALPARCFKVVLDEKGMALTTRELAARIARWREGGSDVAFIIGGADGTAAAVREAAELLWSLSPLTLPHGLVRVVLAEQLYRALSILEGHPYHRD